MKTKLILTITLTFLSMTLSFGQTKKKMTNPKVTKTYIPKKPTTKKSVAKVQNDSNAEKSYVEEKPNERTGTWSYTKEEKNSSLFESTRTFKIKAFLDGKYHSGGTLYIESYDAMDDNENEFTSYILSFCGYEKENSMYTNSTIDDLVKKCLKDKYNAVYFNF